MRPALIMDTGLDGKRVLVTGASGGIGAACARAFAAEGGRLALHWHRGRERAEALAEELDGATLVQSDLTREYEAERLFGEAREALGGLDACAAVAGADGLRPGPAMTSPATHQAGRAMPGWDLAWPYRWIRRSRLT
jgi:NAD(P)-dependent dehydrogenase (short-subunit alcohol dehydrogenase family)